MKSNNPFKSKLRYYASDYSKDSSYKEGDAPEESSFEIKFFKEEIKAMKEKQKSLTWMTK